MFNRIKIIQVLSYVFKGRKTVGECNAGPSLNTTLDSNSVGKIRTNSTDDMRAIFANFAKKRPTAYSMNGNSVNGVLLKAGEMVANSTMS
jgi:hypothetical protein